MNEYFFGILFAIFVGISYYFHFPYPRKKYLKPAFKYAKVSKEKIEDLTGPLIWLPCGRWTKLSQDEKKKYLEKKGIKLVDKYCAFVWIYSSLMYVLVVVVILLMAYYIL